MSKFNIPEIQLDVEPHNDNIETWDYKGYDPDSGYVQKDWNITLITKINRLSTKIHRKTLRGGGDTIIANPRFKPLLMANLLYDEIDGDNGDSVFGRYRVHYDDSIPNDEIRLLYNTTLEYMVRKKDGVEKKFMYISDNVVEPNGNMMGEVSFRLYDFDNEEDLPIINEHLSKITSKVVISNYTDDDVKIEKEQREYEAKLEAPTKEDIIKAIDYEKNKVDDLMDNNYQNDESKPLEEIPYISNEELLTKYQESSSAAKGMIFYFVRVAPRDYKEKRAYVNNNLMTRFKIIPLDNTEKSLEIMNEISNAPNFSHWAKEGFNATDKKNYDYMWNKDSIESEVDNKLVTDELETATYTRLATTQPELIDDLKNNLNINGMEFQIESLSKELSDIPEAKILLSTVKNVDHLINVMDKLGYELSEPIADVGGFSLKRYWVKTNRNPISDDLMNEWERFMYNSNREANEDFIKLIKELVDIEIKSKIYAFTSFSSEDIENLVIHVIYNIHNFDPNKGKIVPYIRTMIRSKARRLKQ